MVKPMNALGISAACLGNHDLVTNFSNFQDLGEEQAINLNSQCNFPWLLSNVKLVDGEQVAKTKPYHIEEKSGYKIGFLGIAEFEWIATLSTFDVEDLEYEDFVECSNRMGKELREEHGCDMVIVLSHMRVPNDRKLAEECTEVDLFLGGHDHVKMSDLIPLVLHP